MKAKARRREGEGKAKGRQREGKGKAKGRQRGKEGTSRSSWNGFRSCLGRIYYLAHYESLILLQNIPQRSKI